jgi:hypothetical protein
MNATIDAASVRYKTASVMSRIVEGCPMAPDRTRQRQALNCHRLGGPTPVQAFMQMSSDDVKPTHFE